LIRDATLYLFRLSHCLPANLFLLSSPYFSLSSSRDAVLLIAGPDKGRTGVLIGIEQAAQSARKGIVKLDSTITGVREIKVMPMSLIAKRMDDS